MRATADDQNTVYGAAPNQRHDHAAQDSGMPFLCITVEADDAVGAKHDRPLPLDRLADHLAFTGND